jgi:hypothetical protein
MLVKVRHLGRKILGLNVGVSNVRRYFPKGSSSVDLHLDHLEIQCELPPAFWQHEPHILDPRLSAWLEAKNLPRGRKQSAVRVALVPADQRSFRLQLWLS